MHPNRSSMPAGVMALAISAFAIGSSEFIVVGILPAIAADLGIALDGAGSLVSLYALALALGTPLLVLALSRWPRKRVLAGLITVFLVGNLLSALSSNFTMLLSARMLTAVAHGCFFAIGATVAAALVSQQQAGRAIATMFAGLTLAMVVGVPLGIALLFAWGLFSFGLGPPLQSAMLATAQRHTPQAVDFASGLNISAFNLGISLGAWVGSVMVARGAMALSPWAGCVAAVAGLLPLAWLAARQRRPILPVAPPTQRS